MNGHSWETGVLAPHAHRGSAGVLWDDSVPVWLLPRLDLSVDSVSLRCPASGCSETPDSCLELEQHSSSCIHTYQFASHHWQRFHPQWWTIEILIQYSTHWDSSLWLQFCSIIYRLLQNYSNIMECTPPPHSSIRVWKRNKFWTGIQMGFE